jgi:SiaC family regulatory phosphoprotein
MHTIQNIYIPSSNHSPEIDFNFSENKIKIYGESFPENAKAFYAPIFDSLSNYLRENHKKTIFVDFGLKYFNSATTRLIYKMFQYFSDSVNDFDHQVEITVHLDEEDEMIRDFFSEIKNEYSNLIFHEVMDG